MVEQHALDDLLQQVEKTAEGLPDPPKVKPSENGSGRNIAAAQLAGRLVNRGAPLKQVKQLVERENAKLTDPLPTEELERTVFKSAERWDADAEKLPEHIRDSDIGNGIAYAGYVASQLLWDGTNKIWWYWNGARWTEDVERRHELFLKPVIDGLYQEAALLDDDRRQRRMKFLTNGLKARHKHVAMIEGAKAYLPVNPLNFDADPYVLAFDNGVLDLITSEFTSPDPEHLNTKTTLYRYDPAAECPAWLAFLDQIFQEDRGWIRALQLIMGESLSGETGKDIFPIFWGEGANGKSQTVTVMMRVLGDYAKATQSSVFAARERESIKGWHIYPLVGARLVTAVESEGTRFLNESVIKNMTGDDAMQAEKKFGTPFEFKPRWLPVLVTNSKPRVRGANEAIWRRLRLVEFNYVIPEAQRVIGYAEKYPLGELPGIFNWALEGFQAIQANEGRVDLGDRVQSATEAYRDSQDVLGEWLAQRTEKDTEARETLKATYESYKSFHGETDNPLGKRAFQDAMEERGYRTVVGGGRTRFITGLNLTDQRAEGEL